MYLQFNIQQIYVLPTQFIYVFCVVLRTISEYFLIQLRLIGFHNWYLTLYSQVVTIYTDRLTFNNSKFWQHKVFMRYVWIWKHLAFISLYNLNWPDNIT